MEGGVLPGASYEEVDGVDCKNISRIVSKASKVYEYRMYRSIIKGGARSHSLPAAPLTSLVMLLNPLSSALSRAVTPLSSGLD